MIVFPSFLVIILFGCSLINSHQIYNYKELNSDDESNDFAYLSHLLRKYTKDRSKFDLHEFDSFIDKHLSIIYNQTNDFSNSRQNLTHNIKFNCYKSRISEFRLKLSDLTNMKNSPISYVNLNQFFKFNTFLISNIDNCFDSENTELENETSVSESRSIANETNFVNETEYQNDVFRRIVHEIKTNNG
jgi:hypothetical protein